MADVADAEDIADDAVAVAVEAFAVGLQIVDDHLALQLGTLLGVKADIVGLVIPGQRIHVQFAGRAVGRLAVKPDHGLLVVGDAGGKSCAAEGHNHDQNEENCESFLHVSFLHTDYFRGIFPFIR